MEEFAESNAATGWPEIPLPSVVPQPQGAAGWPAAGSGPPPNVAGAMIGLLTAPEALLQCCQGQNSKKQAKRGCKRCLANNGGDTKKCAGWKGSSKCCGSNACQHFSASQICRVLARQSRSTTVEPFVDRTWKVGSTFEIFSALSTDELCAWSTFLTLSIEV